MTRLAAFAGCLLALAGCSDTGGSDGGALGGNSSGGVVNGSAGQTTSGSSAAGEMSQAGSHPGVGGSAGQVNAGGAGSAGVAGSAGGVAGSGGSAIGGSGGGVIDEPGPASLLEFDWGKAVIDTRLATPTFNGSYQDGLALRGLYLAYKRLKDEKYLQALTKAADSYAAPAGNNLDEMMHMEAVVDAFELTKKESYRAPATTTRARYDKYPKADGVFWHGQSDARRQQLWADGTFMSLAFLTRYGTVFDDASIWPIAATQLVNTQKHLQNPATGLLWHAWDESGVASWSDHPSKTNEIHWGRAMGWFAVASVMTLEALPEGDPGRAPVEEKLKVLLTSLAKYQDPTTGRWFQVVDQPKDSRNWLETSCSAMFSYASWWAYKHRVVDASFADVAKKGLRGVLQKVKKDANNRTTIETTCTGLSASDDLVGNYFNHGRADNDPHGIGIFILMWEGMQ